MYWCCWTGCSTLVSSRMNSNSLTLTQTADVGLTEVVIWSGTLTQHILLMTGYLDSSRISTADSSQESLPCWNTSAKLICKKRKTEIMFVYPLIKQLASCCTRMAKEVQTKFPNANMLVWQWWSPTIAMFVALHSSLCAAAGARIQIFLRWCDGEADRKRWETTSWKQNKA